MQGVAKRILLSEIEQAASPLTIEELETGLRSGGAFGDENVEAFRDTVIAAIQETSALLLDEDMPTRWREQLGRQVRHMRRYVEIADLYLARQNGTATRLIVRFTF